mmetsp:Transcript_30168/g.86574  ORF Transcript_30168/g.86574 Transcript_30168/m.86574 type:complete len:219 (+) Transcript_30168:161-817(+)
MDHPEHCLHAPVATRELLDSLRTLEHLEHLAEVVVRDVHGTVLGVKLVQPAYGVLIICAGHDLDTELFWSALLLDESLDLPLEGLDPAVRLPVSEDKKQDWPFAAGLFGHPAHGLRQRCVAPGGLLEARGEARVLGAFDSLKRAPVQEEEIHPGLVEAVAKLNDKGDCLLQLLPPRARRLGERPLADGRLDSVHAGRVVYNAHNLVVLQHHKVLGVGK